VRKNVLVNVRPTPSASVSVMNAAEAEAVVAIAAIVTIGTMAVVEEILAHHVVAEALFRAVASILMYPRVDLGEEGMTVVNVIRPYIAVAEAIAVLSHLLDAAVSVGLALRFQALPANVGGRGADHVPHDTAVNHTNATHTVAVHGL
jgi:hypothetical protein